MAEKNNHENLESLYPAIGEFLVKYATVQGLMRTILLSIIDIPPDAGALILEGMSDQKVHGKIQYVFNKPFHKHSSFGVGLKRLKKVEKFRNRLIHWEPMITPDQKGLVALANAYGDYKNLRNPKIVLKKKDLENLSNWLLAFSNDLLQLEEHIRLDLELDISTFSTLDELTDPVIPKAEYTAKK